MNLIIICKQLDKTYINLVKYFNDDVLITIRVGKYFDVIYDHGIKQFSSYEQLLMELGNFLFEHKIINRLECLDESLYDLACSLKRDFAINSGIEQYQINQIYDKRFFKSTNFMIKNNFFNKRLIGLIDEKSNILYKMTEENNQFSIDVEPKLIDVLSCLIKKLNIKQTYFDLYYNKDNLDVVDIIFCLPKPYYMDLLNFVNSVNGYEIFAKLIHNEEYHYQVNTKKVIISNKGNLNNAFVTFQYDNQDIMVAFMD